ncbi:hypothetical protein EDD17DRAFT_1526011 [Pisolithus thermaeus]|nr:hypothetical protein EDD17DRAFT_1526011 [Pisolithus thermaeus]
MACLAESLLNALTCTLHLGGMTGSEKIFAPPDQYCAGSVGLTCSLTGACQCWVAISLYPRPTCLITAQICCGHQHPNATSTQRCHFVGEVPNCTVNS